ncbi:MAG TPA: threonine synthase, partial [Chitinophagaceae bacterium]|nr:threonine synthase [Chitinophagaceae bacterium]
AACNVNDVVSGYLQTEILKPKQAIPTLSNAMDVGDPSNFIRIPEIFHHHFPELKEALSSCSISDEETLTTIKDVYQQYNYLLDPHGAVGYLSLQRYLNKFPGKGIFLETAHPVKFPDAVEKATGIKVELPASLADLMKEEKQSILMENDFDRLKEYLLR